MRALGVAGFALVAFSSAKPCLFSWHDDPTPAPDAAPASTHVDAAAVAPIVDAALSQPDASHDCKPPCTLGRVCINRSCVCPHPGDVLCAKGCTNPKTDNFACGCAAGGAGKVCAKSEECCGAQCVACAAGQSIDHATCACKDGPTPPTPPSTQACQPACTGAKVCVNGSCTCPACPAGKVSDAQTCACKAAEQGTYDCFPSCLLECCHSATHDMATCSQKYCAAYPASCVNMKIAPGTHMDAKYYAKCAPWQGKKTNSMSDCGFFPTSNICPFGM